VEAKRQIEFEAIRLGIEPGLILLDTAEMYFTISINIEFESDQNSQGTSKKCIGDHNWY
jgi:hypothetical protein